MVYIHPDYVRMEDLLIASKICTLTHVRLNLISGLGHMTIYMSKLQYMLII